MEVEEYLSEMVNGEETRLQFVRNSEEQFGMGPTPVEKLTIVEIDEWVEFLGYLWTK